MQYLFDLYGNRVPAEWDPILDSNIYASGRSRTSGLSEDSLELLDLTAAIARAKGTFKFLSAGCGYGRWFQMAASICSILSLDYTFVGYEANGIRHRQCTTLFPESKHSIIYGAVMPYMGTVEFPQTENFGDAVGIGATLNCYLPNPSAFNFMNMDIQGMELKVLEAMDISTLTMAHISTHSSDIHAGVANLFKDRGWKKRYSIPKDSPLGFGKAVDGIQSWENPNVY